MKTTEKNKPLSLDFDAIRDKVELIGHKEFRPLHPGIGMVISFAEMKSELFRTGQPYRTKESRIIRVLEGSGRVSINLMEYEIKEQMLIITPPNSLIEMIEISEDYDFQVLVTENDFLPTVQGSSIMDFYGQYGNAFPLTTEEWQHTEIFFNLLWETMHRTPFRREVIQYMVTALLYDIIAVR